MILSITLTSTSQLWVVPILDYSKYQYSKGNTVYVGLFLGIELVLQPGIMLVCYAFLRKHIEGVQFFKLR